MIVSCCRLALWYGVVLLLGRVCCCRELHLSPMKSPKVRQTTELKTQFFYRAVSAFPLQLSHFRQTRRQAKGKGKDSGAARNTFGGSRRLLMDDR